MTLLAELHLNGNLLSGSLAPCAFPRWSAAFGKGTSYDFTSNRFSGRLKLPCLRMGPLQWWTGAKD